MQQRTQYSHLHCYSTACLLMELVAYDGCEAIQNFKLARWNAVQIKLKALSVDNIAPCGLC